MANLDTLNKVKKELGQAPVVQPTPATANLSARGLSTATPTGGVQYASPTRQAYVSPNPVGTPMPQLGSVSGSPLPSNSLPAGGQYVGQVTDPNRQALQQKSQQDLDNYYAGVDQYGNPTGSGDAPIPDRSVAGFNSVTSGNPAYNQNTGQEKNSQLELSNILANIDKNAAATNAAGNYMSDAEVQSQKQTAIAKYNAEQQKAASDKSAAQQQQATDTANSTGVVTPPTTPQDAGIQAALGSLPAEFSFLGPLFQKQQDTINQAIGSNTEMAQQQQALIDSSFGSVAENIKSMQESMKESSSAIQGLIQEAQQSSEQALAVQKKAEQERAAWDNLQIQRQTSKQQAEQHQSMVAQIALAGGFGQDAGMAAVAASDASFEDRIATLRTEGSVQQMEIASKYSTLYAQNKQDYIGKTITNMQDLQTKLESLNQQGNQNTTAWASAQSGIMDKWWNNQTSLSKESAKNSLDMGKEISGIIQQEKSDKIDKQNSLWDRLYKQRAQDGNLNPALTNKILSEMQDAGIDVSGLDASSMTLEQQNEMYRRAKDASDRANAGKIPLSTQVQQLTDADKAFNLMDKAEAAIKEYAGVGGPIGGMTGLGDTDPSWIAKIGKFGADVATGLGGGGAFEKQREAVATFNLVQQVIGKALEGGVLRKEDEVKYSKLLPNLRDTDELRQYKLDQLREMMSEGKKSLLDNMSRSGYDTSGYNVDGTGKPFDPINNPSKGTLTNEEVDDIMNKIESGEPITQGPTGFLNTLAAAHVKHEGYGTKNAVTITANNNPGALRWANGQTSFNGVKPGARKPDGTTNDTGFTWFPDPASGYRALAADLRAKLTGGSSHIDYSKNPTMLDYISVYAPAGDRNNPSAYTNALVAQLQKSGYDVSPNTPLSELSRFLS